MINRPNGALQYAMDFLNTNFSWLEDQVKKSTKEFFLVDFPGQIELYMGSPVMKQLINSLSKIMDVCVVQMFDSFFCRLISLREFQIHLRVSVLADDRGHI